MPRNIFSATEDEIRAHQERVAANAQKQRDEDDPGHTRRARDIPIGGCSGVGERYRGGQFSYCPSPGRCKADETMMRKESRPC